MSLAEWGAQILVECAPVAAALDAANQTTAYGDALASARGAVNDQATTPSARVLAAMARDHDDSYTDFVLAQSVAHRDTLLKLPFSTALADRFARQAAESRSEQRAIEAADTLPFETFRQNYLSPASLNL